MVADVIQAELEALSWVYSYSDKAAIDPPAAGGVISMGSSSGYKDVIKVETVEAGMDTFNRTS